MNEWIVLDSWIEVLSKKWKEEKNYSKTDYSNIPSYRKPQTNEGDRSD